MFSKGCHVIGEHALTQELRAEQSGRHPVVPERPYAEMCKAQPQTADSSQPQRNQLFSRIGLR